MLSLTIATSIVLQVHKHKIMKAMNLYSRLEGAPFYICCSSPKKISVPFLSLLAVNAFAETSTRWNLRIHVELIPNAFQFGVIC